jgi:hypothetical protein
MEMFVPLKNSILISMTYQMTRLGKREAVVLPLNYARQNAF